MTKLRHIGILVSNYPKMINFYINILGLTNPKTDTEDGKYIDNIYHKENTVIKTIKFDEGVELIILEKPFKPIKWINGELTDCGITHYALTVTNLDEIYGRIKGSEGVIHSSIQTSPSGKVRLAFVRDPDGSLIELVEEINE
jgi:catechol 2,3-dioxygenase-like lactoylglutathione lyase family enzyme